MSRDYPVAYFPPTGTKYQWSAPSLKHLGWACTVHCLKWPQSLTLTVDRVERGYFGDLSFKSINGGKVVTRRTRYYKTPLTALLAIEKAGDELLKEDIQPWMNTALKLGWRPPA